MKLLLKLILLWMVPFLTGFAFSMSYSSNPLIDIVICLLIICIGAFLFTFLVYRISKELFISKSNLDNTKGTEENELHKL